LGIEEGNLSFDACIAPAAMNGVYFLNGGGPLLANITLSYKIGGGGSSGSSSGSSYSPPPSSFEGSKEESSTGSESTSGSGSGSGCH